MTKEQKEEFKRLIDENNLHEISRFIIRNLEGYRKNVSSTKRLDDQDDLYGYLIKIYNHAHKLGEKHGPQENLTPQKHGHEAPTDSPRE